MTLVMMDKFIQMDLLLPSQKVYGLGERVHEFQLGEGTWTMWASGQDSPYDDGQGRKGLYGVHPFVLVQSGKAKDDYFGMFFRNSNAQSPVLSYLKDGKAVLSYITIGGQLEVYFFLHGSAKNVVQQYQSMFGKP
jgi:alpha-glucosidase (family GH31 glycosyl hydrolase)